MKYFLLTITFFIIIILLITGFLFYNSYTLWLNNKDEIIERLLQFKDLLEGESRKEINLAPNLKTLENTVIYDRKLKVIGEFSYGQREILSFNEINPLLIYTLLLMEDERFYFHNGFDLKGIFGALIEDLRTLSFARGGSTITQQLAKVLFTDSKKTIRRKIYELFCTFEIEKRFTKNEILTLYLNSIYFGHNIYGIESAAQFYFKKEAFNLDIYEASLLVGIVPGPNRYSPFLNPDRCKRKQKIVLNALIENEIIDTQFVLETLDTFWDQFFTFKHRPSISIWSMKQNKAPYFIEYIRQDLEKTFDQDLIKQGGLRIYTTLDLEINRMADKALIEGLNYQEQRTREIIGEVDQSVEGAITTIDPKSGHILVMIGGSGFTMDNQFNRVISARRQIGSAFKPFVYAVAFESNGFQPDSEIEDKPITIQTQSGLWKPSNYNNTYYGRVTLEFALKKSLNSVAVQLAQETGSEKIIKLIGNALDLEGEQIEQRFKPYPSIALGVYSFSPLEVVRAYAIFPNHGEKIFPISILRVEDTAGIVVLDNEGEKKKAETVYDLYDNLRIIERSTAETINTMLKEVIKRGGTAYQAILASGLVIDGSGKTGTTDNYTDAWFIGYTEDMVTAVWVGFDDPRYSLGKGQAGGVVAAPIWASFMKQALWRD